jgi:hypothetical protein
MVKNQGFDPEEISRFRKELAQSGKSFQYIDPEEVSGEMAEFLFIGKFEGKEVIFDCLLGTLQLAYESNLMELAEAKAKLKFPNYKGFDFEIDENGNAIAQDEEVEEIEEYKAFAMFEIEEAGEAKVAESLSFDTTFDYGIGLEAYLNTTEINEEVIQDFIDSFNSGSLKLDPTLYAFEAEEEED